MPDDPANTTTTTEQVPPPPAAPPRNKDEARAELYTILGVTVGVFFLAAIVVAFVDRWRKTQARGAAASATLTLTDYREMYDSGEITEKEYTRIRDKMAAKMKAEVGLGPKPVPPPAPPPVPPPAAPPDAWPGGA